MKASDLFPIFIKGVADYSGYDEDGKTLIPDYCFQYANIYNIISIEELADKYKRTFTFGDEVYNCEYEVKIPAGSIFITKEQFDRIMNEFSYQAF